MIDAYMVAIIDPSDFIYQEVPHDKSFMDRRIGHDGAADKS